MDKHSQANATGRTARALMAVGDRIEVTAERWAHGGTAIGTYHQVVVFLSGALPGETVHATVTAVKKRHAEATVIDGGITHPSPYRVQAVCPVAAAGGGCCDLTFVSQEGQEKLAELTVREQLQRVGGYDPADIPTPTHHRLGEPGGYRTRVRLGVNSAGVPGVRKLNGTDIVPITTAQCVQNAPEINEALAATAAAHRFSPGGEVVAALDSRGDVHIGEAAKAARGHRVSSTLRLLQGSGAAIQKVGQESFHVPLAGFWQAHAAAPQAYVDQVAAFCAEVPAGVMWDLYGGIGLLALPLRDRNAAAASSPAQDDDRAVAAVYSVESARVTRASKIDGIIYRHGDVASVVAQLPAPQAVVLDPPRKGAGEAVVRAIAAAKPRRVLHIGCDPATFARDSAAWVASGYRLSSVDLFHAFPGTHHVETFGVFEPSA